MKLGSIVFSTLLFVSLALVSTGLIQPPTKNVFEINITVEGIKNSKGKIRLSLQKNEKLFNTEKGIKKSRWKVAQAKSGEITLTFDKVQPGRYAISVFHDENNNKSLDKDLFEAPAESYGFSNNPKIKQGPPKFTEVAFDHKKNQNLIIRLNHPVN